MSAFDAVTEYPDGGDSGSESTATGEPVTDGGTTIQVPDVGRVEAWLADRNLTVSEAALIVQTVNVLVVTFVLYRQVND